MRYTKYHKDRSKKLGLKLINRVSIDLNNGDIEKAISRYEGFFNTYPTNQNIHNKVAELYINQKEFLKAGKHLFFKEHLNLEEKQCVFEFEKSCGNSPTLILKKIIPKNNYKVRLLDYYAKIKLKNLIEQATIESNVTPNFLKGIRTYFNKY